MLRHGIVSPSTPEDVARLRALARRFRLEHMSSVEAFSDEEILREYNGVGPDRWPAFARIVLSAILFDALPAVLVHDMDYVVGGDEWVFHESNRVLGRNVRAIAVEKRRPWDPRRWFLFPVSWIMPWLTDLFGKPGWNWGNPVGRSSTGTAWRSSGKRGVERPAAGW